VAIEWRVACAPRHQMFRQHSRQDLRSCGCGDGNTCCNPHPPAVMSADGCRSDTCLTRQRGAVDLHVMRCTWTVRFDLLVSFGGRDGGLVHEASSPHPLPIGSVREGASGWWGMRADGPCRRQQGSKAPAASTQLLRRLWEPSSSHR
jgi:hypothetical protein